MPARGVVLVLITPLFHAQVKPWMSERRRSFVKDVLDLYGVEQDGGELVCTVNNVADLGDEIIRLGQACLRVSDLIFTKRMAITSSMVEQVESVLEFGGRFGKPVRLDFVVQQAEQPAAGILTLTKALSAGGSGEARGRLRSRPDVRLQGGHPKISEAIDEVWARVRHAVAVGVERRGRLRP